MEDYEHLAREAAPEVARVRCVTAGDGADAGGVRILVVPAAGSSDGRLRFEQLVPNEETLQRISRRLDGSRVIGTRVLVEPPVYRGVTVVAKLRPRASANATRLQADALDALYHYFHPVSGGPDRTGWPFGRPVHVGEVYSVLQGLRGTELVEDARLFGADPVTGQRGRALVAKAFDFYRMRGTAGGLQAQLELLTGGTIELHETGGMATSTAAGAALPGSPNFALLVRVTVDDPTTVNAGRLNALVAAAKPAHVTHKVEVVKRAEVKEVVEVTSE